MQNNPPHLMIVDPVGGAAGDMWLGALVDLGLPWDKLKRVIAGLGLTGYTFDQEAVYRSGIKGTKVTIRLTEGPQEHRSLAIIAGLIEKALLPQPVKDQAIRIFTRLAEAEATVHGCPVEAVHFHELGAVDALVDIVGTCWGLNYLGVGDIFVLPLPLGSGFVKCAHGELPVPTPATGELVAGFPVCFAGGPGEALTPTGAALCTTLGRPIDPGEIGVFRIRKIGYGAGSRQSGDRPNVLRLLLAQAANPDSANQGDYSWETIAVLEATVDDMNPQWFAPLTEQLFAAGALDVRITATLMKKGRPGHHLTVLCPPVRQAAVLATLFAGSTTLGIRCHREARAVLRREVFTIPTRYGPIQVKRGIAGNKVLNLQPEYEDCLRAAREHNIPVKTIYQHVLAVCAAEKKDTI
ncbi:MAG: nickel pincer cofactor biosynthesis protein LarC [Heliobacteriaceae bacterium]|nr:nickel pincer cofactor biosynthesis protein LarC [Heliobacteriaceae bacterium]